MMQSVSVRCGTVESRQPFEKGQLGTDAELSLPAELALHEQGEHSAVQVLVRGEIVLVDVREAHVARSEAAGHAPVPPVLRLLLCCQTGG